MRWHGVLEIVSFNDRFRLCNDPRLVILSTMLSTTSTTSTTFTTSTTSTTSTTPTLYPSLPESTRVYPSTPLGSWQVLPWILFGARTKNTTLATQQKLKHVEDKKKCCSFDTVQHSTTVLEDSSPGNEVMELSRLAWMHGLHMASLLFADSIWKHWYHPDIIQISSVSCNFLPHLLYISMRIFHQTLHF